MRVSRFLVFLFLVHDACGLICFYCAFVESFYCEIGVKLPNMICDEPVYDRENTQPICFSAFSQNNHSFHERGCTKAGPTYDHCEKLKRDHNDPSIVCRFCEDDSCNSINKERILKQTANGNFHIKTWMLTLLLALLTVI